MCIVAHSTEFWLYFILAAAGGPRYEMDFDTVVGGDIVYINELNRKQMGFTESMLSICETV